jgi:hypothetical protein
MYVSHKIVAGYHNRFQRTQRGQILGYDGCYDSGTCLYGYSRNGSLWLPFLFCL